MEYLMSLSQLHQYHCQGRIQQVAEGAQAPPWSSENLIFNCLTLWLIEVTLSRSTS